MTTVILVLLLLVATGVAVHYRSVALDAKKARKAAELKLSVVESTTGKALDQLKPIEEAYTTMVKKLSEITKLASSQVASVHRRRDKELVMEMRQLAVEALEDTDGHYIYRVKRELASKIGAGNWTYVSRGIDEDMWVMQGDFLGFGYTDDDFKSYGNTNLANGKTYNLHADARGNHGDKRINVSKIEEISVPIITFIVRHKLTGEEIRITSAADWTLEKKDSGRFVKECIETVNVPCRLPDGQAVVHQVTLDCKFEKPYKESSTFTGTITSVEPLSTDFSFYVESYGLVIKGPALGEN